MTEECWNPDRWEKAPRKCCPCVIQRHNLAVSCGAHEKPVRRPVLMCRYAPPLVEMLNANGKGE